MCACVRVKASQHPASELCPVGGMFWSPRPGSRDLCSLPDTHTRLRSSLSPSRPTQAAGEGDRARCSLRKNAPGLHSLQPSEAGLAPF